jgi:transposase
VAMEATTNTWAIVDLLEPFVAEVVVSNPMRTKAIASAKVKTDKVDATILAQLLRCDFLPPVWIPGPALRQLRSLTSRRAVLTHHQTAMKNRIHSVLHQRLMSVPEGLFDAKGLDWLWKVELDPPDERPSTATCDWRPTRLNLNSWTRTWPSGAIRMSE